LTFTDTGIPKILLVVQAAHAEFAVKPARRTNPEIMLLVAKCVEFFIESSVKWFTLMVNKRN